MARRDDPRQMNLFEAPAPPAEETGALYITDLVRETVNAMIKDCPYSREQIAERMSVLSGARITPVMLNAWTAQSRLAHRFPLEYLPALERATESTALTDLLAGLAGGEIYYGPEALKARLGLLEMEKQTLAENIKALKQKARTA